MAETTATRVLRVLENYHLKHKGGGRYRSRSPLRPNSDSDSFSLLIDPDGESGAFRDFAGTQHPSGSLYELANLLGVPTTPRDPNWQPPPRKQVEPSRRAYANLEEYAQFKGVPESAFVKAGWKEAIYRDRPALEYPTATGKRWRFMDGEKPKFTSSQGYKSCWYGLKTAVPMATEKELPLVICNGEPSVVVGQHFGVPACCITAGESQDIKPEKLAELVQVWQGDILIAFDCDKAGNAGALALAESLTVLGYYTRPLDLYLTDKGDLADVCKLYGILAMPYLNDCKRIFPTRADRKSAPADDFSPEPPADLGFDIQLAHKPGAADKPLGHDGSDGLRDFVEATINGNANKGIPLPNPYRWLHRYGGAARLLYPGALFFIVSISGGTKTIGIETAFTRYMREGIQTIVFSPELSPANPLDNQFYARMLQRHGGPPAIRIMEHFAALGNIRGTNPLSGDEIGQLAIAEATINSSGTAMPYFVNGNPTIEQIVRKLPEAIRYLQERGRPPRVFLLDYAQIIDVEARRINRNYVEDGMKIIKRMCEDNGLIGIVTSQSNKDAAESISSGGEFTISGMQYLRNDICSAQMWVAPEVDLYTRRRMYAGSNRVRMRGLITKNTWGDITDEEFPFIANFDRYEWEAAEQHG